MMSEYEYKILTPAEVRKLKRIFAHDRRFRHRKDQKVPANMEHIATKCDKIKV